MKIQGDEYEVFSKEKKKLMKLVLVFFLFINIFFFFSLSHYDANIGHYYWII